MGVNVPVVPTSTALPTPTPKALIRSSTLTHASSRTHDTGREHPRRESSQMDVRSMIVAGVTISRTEDEDPAECFDSHEDAIAGRFCWQCGHWGGDEGQPEGTWTTRQIWKQWICTQLSARSEWQHAGISSTERRNPDLDLLRESSRVTRQCTMWLRRARL